METNNRFQEDLFPPTFDGKPSMSASEWFSGANKPGTLFYRIFFFVLFVSVFVFVFVFVFVLFLFLFFVYLFIFLSCYLGVY
jgi:hypothetical protein